MRWVVFFLLTFGLPALAIAQQTLTLEEVAATEEPPQEVPDSERERPFYSGVFSLGGGLLFLFGDDLDRDAIPTVNIEFRKMFVIGGVFGLEWMTNITMHDWETIGNVYKWYNKGERDDVLLKYTVLFPGLILAPLFGSNMSTGLGIIIHTASQAPSFYFDGGGQFSLFLRPSDPDVKFDLGFGSYVGTGFDFSRRFGIGFRMLWGPPSIHSLINRSRRSIVALSATLNFGY